MKKQNGERFASICADASAISMYRKPLLYAVLLWSFNGALYGTPLHMCRESNGGCRTHHHR
ncbi:hypothetical protein OROGR_031222 [Orobanche gracilis]